MYKLIIQDDEGKTTVVPLIREELTIGRQEGNTIRLTERNVSRRHAKLLRGQEAIMIEDLDSYNGVRVNGSRITGKVAIQEADRVQIGDYLIEVKADKPDAVDATEQETREFKQISSSVPVGLDASEAVTVANPALSASGSGEHSTAAISAAAATQTEACARMVILSTNMAGREFELTQPSMVIGRTEENDLWINHRSISRHHAKIVREGDSYTIVDLQSANGVRVNGEDYGKVELRRGDLVDLGHVRLRFVAPAEDFVFGRDAQAVDIAAEESKGKGIWIALLLLCVAIAAFFLFFRGETEKDAGQVKASVLDASSPAEVVTNPQPADAAGQVAVQMDASKPVTPPTSDEVGALLSSAKKAATASNWDAMKKAANDALAIEPANEEARALLAKAELEAGNKVKFDKFRRAVSMDQYVTVASMFDLIEDGSVYKEMARPEHDRLKTAYHKQQIRIASKSAARKNCMQSLAGQANQIPAEWSDIADAVRAIDCKSSVAANTGKPNRPLKPPTKPTNTKPKPNTVLSADEISQMLSESKEAIRNKQYGKGQKLCSEILKSSPGLQEAVMTCTIAACNLKRSTTALRYWRRIRNAGRKASAKQICIRLGVDGFIQ